MSNREEIGKMWSIFHPRLSSPLSLRAIWPKGFAGQERDAVNVTFTAAGYPEVADRQQAFEDEALRLNGEGYNVYIVMNRIRADFSGGAVSDADIEARTLLLIDIDRSSGTGRPATDDEVQAAIDLGQIVTDDMAERSGAKPSWVMSGNGVHLYYRLERCPNAPETREEVRELLQLLAKKFDNGQVQIDTSVSNASRITKAPGTIARKGAESADRPYRMARVL